MGWKRVGRDGSPLRNRPTAPPPPPPATQSAQISATTKRPMHWCMAAGADRAFHAPPPKRVWGNTSLLFFAVLHGQQRQE